MLVKVAVVITVLLWCIMGVVMAIKNAIRSDPPFTIVEKREKIDAETRKKLEKMIDDMKED